MEKFNFNTPEEDAEVGSKKPEYMPSGRFKRFVHSAMAAATLLGTLPSERAVAAETQDNKADTQPIEQLDTMFQEKEWLSEFGISELSIGQPEHRTRSLVRQIGIYYKGMHLGDLRSQRSALFEKLEFVKGVTKILDDNNITHKNANPNQELFIGLGVKEKIKELGMIVGQKINEKGKKVMTLSANTNLPDKKDAIYFELDIEDDGRPDSFARLEVSNNDTLILEGKDGESFDIEFVKDKYGKIIVIEK